MQKLLKYYKCVATVNKPSCEGIDPAGAPVATVLSKLTIVVIIIIYDK